LTGVNALEFLVKEGVLSTRREGTTVLLLGPFSFGTGPGVSASFDMACALMPAQT